MRKTVKGSVVALAAFVLVGCFAGCSFSDLVPEEFGAWENNYIYRGNVRSKTTGEDWSYLVTEVTEGDKAYEVVSCNDHAISGDDIYMCLSLDDKATAEVESVGGIVRYNVREKTQENVSVGLCVVRFETDGEQCEETTWSYEPYHIEKLFESELLLYGQRTEENGASESLYYRVDLEGKLTEERSYDYSDCTRVGEDHYMQIRTDENGAVSLYYLTWGMTEPAYVCSLEGVTKTEFVDKEGAQGFLLTSEYTDETDKEKRACKKVEFVGLSGGKTEIYDGLKNAFTWCAYPENEYFLTAESKQITYMHKDSFFGKATEQTRWVWQNCVLHKVDYAESGVTVETVYTFESDKEVTLFGVKEGKIYLNTRWYENARGCSGGGAKGASYTLDLDSKKLKRVSVGYSVEAMQYSADMIDYRARQEGVVYGNYVYYINKETYGPLLDKKSTAYFLERYDQEKKKTETMQIWSSNTYQPEGAKFCEQMWKHNGGELSDFIVRNY